MKTSAVDWLKTELEKHGSPDRLWIKWSTFDQLVEEAKVKENTSIRSANNRGKTIAKRKCKK